MKGIDMKETKVCITAREIRREGDECLNLREREEGSGLRVVEGFRDALGMMSMGRPVLRTSVEDDGVSIFHASGSRLSVSTNGSQHEPLGRLGGRVVEMANLGRGRVVATVEGGAPEFGVRDFGAGVWRWLGPIPRFSVPTLTTQATAIAESRLKGRRLSGDYHQGVIHLTSEDEAKVSADYFDALMRLEQSGRATGSWVQPIFARIVLTGYDGSTLYRGAPLMVGEPQGVGVERYVYIDGTSYRELREDTLTGTAYRLKLAFGPMGEEWDKWVGEIRVEVSRPLSLAKTGDLSGSRLSHYGSEHGVLEMSLPGTSLSQGADEALSSKAEDLLIGFEEGEAATAWRLVRPTDGWSSLSGTEVVIGRSDSGFGAARESDVGGVFGLPHTFIAGSVSRCGDKILWGNLSRKAFGGYTAGEYSVEQEAGSWSGTHEVTMERDRRLGLCDRFGGTDAGGKTPTKLSAVIVYPDSRVSRIRVTSGSREWVLDMRPSRDGRHSIYINSGLRGLEATGVNSGSDEVPEEVEAEAYGGSLLVTSTDDATGIESSVDTGTGRITAVVSRTNSRTGFDLRRPHWFVFGSEEIYTASLKGGSIGVSLLAHRGSTGATGTSEQVVYAVSGDGILQVNDTKVAQALRGKRYTSIAYDVNGERLWGVDSEGKAQVYSADLSRRYDVGRKINTLYGDGRGILCGTAIGIFEPNDERPGLMEVRWKHREFMGNGVGIERAAWLLTSGTFEGTLTITTDDGDEGIPELVTRMEVTGRVSQPLLSRIVSPCRRYVTVELEGKASEDFVVEGVELGVIKK